MATEDTSSGLPPRPDLETGRPLPPSAPTQFPEGYNEKNTPRFPVPSSGYGPTLVLFHQKRYLSWLGGFIPVVLLILCFLAYDGVKALTLWPIWLILVAVYGWTVYVHHANTVSAGADWVRGGRKHWVNTYELTQIHIRSYNVNEPGLFLADRERTVEISLGLLQSNRKLWDYVHLGMLHSSAGGAELNMAARGAFPELVGKSRDTSSETE